MTPLLCLALALVGETDYALESGFDARAGIGLLPTGGAAAGERSQNRFGANVGVAGGTALVGTGRRYQWGLGLNGDGSIQFGEDVQAASGLFTPEENPARRNFLYFGRVGGTLRGELRLLPGLRLGGDVGGGFSRQDAVAFQTPGADVAGGEAEADAPDAPQLDLLGVPFGAAFIESASVEGGVTLTGSAGRRWTWQTAARAGFAENTALGIVRDPDDPDSTIEVEAGELADVVSVSGEGFADWSATRRTFFGAGFGLRYGGFIGGPEGAGNSLILTSEGRFRRVLSRRWQLRANLGAFVAVPVEEAANDLLRQDLSAFPVAGARIVYSEPQRERFSYDLSFDLSLSPQLNRQLGGVIPELRALISFNASFDEDWRLSSSAFVGTVVDADAFTPDVFAMPPDVGPAPLIQSAIGASVAVIRQLTEEWSASFGVRGGGNTRQLFSIRGQLDRANTPEELRGFDFPLALVLAEFGLSWRSIAPL